MKRAAIIIVLVLLSFSLGWVGACYRMWHAADQKIAFAKNEQARHIREIHEHIYGPTYFHEKGSTFKNEDAVRLEHFDPATSKGFITLSYVGGRGEADIHLKIECTGAVSIQEHGTTRKLPPLDQKICSDFFKRMIASGIINYSNDVIAIKTDLPDRDSCTSVLHAPQTEFLISIPELGIEKTIPLTAPAPDLLKSNPDIIEYQLVATLEHEMLGFIPKDDPLAR
jgi:hypothetical protein